MTWRTENNFTDEAICILEIAEHFLTQYFDHPSTKATELITEYFRRFEFVDVEALIGHELSWEMALRIHFSMALGGEPGKISFWIVENNLQSTPRDALAYMREHYWSRYPMFESD